ncbi:hypothetical protein C8D92_10844 [Tamilnaduibacter salinus]|uniref:GTPase n=1 Tax=Tamilnaduibacter salinus TaxID=1484056 RepID=A0A2U1CUF0_9GAMM|nr:GTPase [Tamilnaduibacter salinus]PVY70688.1 hypothetical protein C8D92_10844 [Tamilnaduibacter salinus]
MIHKPDLTLPEQKIASLSFCETSPKAFESWVKGLPMANLGEASRQLYHGIIELNQLIAQPQQRFQLLELIRPRIIFVCRELARHFLGLSVSLPEKQRKVANLSQALQLHLAAGYKTCLCEALDNGSPDKHRKLIITAAHRIISELGATILRANQLYCPAPINSWLECHRVFRFASRNRLHTTPVSDSALMHRRENTVADAYHRVILLGCARPNQLRQNELKQAYQLFEVWTEQIRCSADIASNALFVANMEQDAPPVYRSLLQEQITSDYFGIDTTVIARQIAEHLNGRDTDSQLPALAMPIAASETLLTHLRQALGTLTERSFRRIASEGTLQVSVGLTATHYFVAGEKQFNEFVAGGQPLAIDNEENRFLSHSRRRNDPWSGAHDAGASDDILRAADTPINYRGGAGSGNNEPERRNQPRFYRTRLVDTSPGGYCIRWGSDLPTSLQSGEILAVREQDSHPWSIALVRWIRQLRHQGTQVGLELLAPSASPCAVRLIQKTGQGSEFLRGILLPEEVDNHQGPTVITPRMPFQEGSRITLLQGGREDQGQLSRRIAATGSISQFELKLFNQGDKTGQIGSASPGGTSEDEFDSLWPSL